MLIKELILKNYKRFALKDIKEFTFTPKTNLTILNWSNGVGKSSLLEQLNPLPANIKKDFNNDGYKSIVIEHLGKTYKLTSEGSKHSFIEDNEELNPGGTRKAQLELVKEKFKLDPSNIKVITGNNDFSSMAPNERKSWLTKISTVDYVYPITIYNKILEARRDNSGVIKNNKEQVAKIEKTLSDAGSIENIEKERIFISELSKEILKAYEYIPKSEDKETIISKLQSLNNIIDRNNLLTVDINIDKLTERYNFIKSKISSITEKENELTKELTELSKTSDPKHLETLKKSILELKDNLKSFPFAKDINTLNLITTMVNTLEVSLKEILTALEKIEDTYTQHDITDKSSLNEIDIILTTLLSSLKTLELKLENINNKSNAITNLTAIELKCNACSNILKIDTLKENLEEEKTKLLEASKKLSNMFKLKELEKKLIIAKETVNNRYNDLIKDNIVFNTLFKDYSVDLTLGNIKILLSALNQFKHDLNTKYTQYIKSLVTLETKYQEESIRSTMASEIVNTKSNSIKSNLKLLEEEKNKYLLALKELDNLKERYDILYKTREAIKDNLKKLQILKSNAYKEIVNETRDMVLKQLEVRLKELDTLVEHRKDLEKQLIMLYKELEYKEKDNETLNLLINTLSPSNGLIAKSINSFIGKFISDVNLVINTVWSYKMKLLPCEVSEESDLDYKFKVEVDDKFIVDDISELSSSMKEIIDLSFRLIYIKYMDLKGVPIILDEFGRTMDAEHRIRAFNMIEEVICNTYEQVFLVSHFEEMYGRFKNADFPSITPNDT